MDRVYFVLGSESFAEPQAPARAYPSDAGWDLFVSRTTEVIGNSFVDVHTDINIAMPPGYWGLITGRSSTVRRRQLRVEPGVVDEGYRGELKIGVWNLSGWVTKVLAGERLAQLIFIASNRFEWREVENLPPGERGYNGFGSTG